VRFPRFFRTSHLHEFCENSTSNICNHLRKICTVVDILGSIYKCSLFCAIYCKILEINISNRSSHRHLDGSLTTPFVLLFSAYKHGNSNYIIDTTHPTSEDYLKFVEEAQASLKSGKTRYFCVFCPGETSSRTFMSNILL
jgi:hypothetical protein